MNAAPTPAVASASQPATEGAFPVSSAASADDGVSFAAVMGQAAANSLPSTQPEAAPAGKQEPDGQDTAEDGDAAPPCEKAEHSGKKPEKTSEFDPTWLMAWMLGLPAPVEPIAPLPAPAAGQDSTQGPQSAGEQTLRSVELQLSGSTTALVPTPCAEVVKQPTPPTVSAMKELPNREVLSSEPAGIAPASSDSVMKNTSYPDQFADANGKNLPSEAAPASKPDILCRAIQRIQRAWSATDGDVVGSNGTTVPTFSDNLGWMDSVVANGKDLSSEAVPASKPDILCQAIQRIQRAWSAADGDVVGSDGTTVPTFSGDLEWMDNTTANGKNLPPEALPASEPNVLGQAIQRIQRSWSVNNGDIVGRDGITVPTFSGNLEWMDSPGVQPMNDVSPVPHTPTLDHLSQQITEHVVAFRRLGTDAMEVTLRAAGNTELSLQLRLHHDGVDALLRVERGDAAMLNIHWKELEHSLAQQGVRLVADRDWAGSASQNARTDSGGFAGADDESPSRRQSPHHDELEELAFAGAATEPLKRSPAKTAGARRKPGMWA